jgi:TetR/AcrR family transcriptional regulator, tetracycline repressor protein
MRLERTGVVRAALDLLNEVGFDGLTIRRLAKQLGVQGPALYWHFKNKQELIDEMALALLADAHMQPRQDEDWAEWLAEGSRRIRRAMLSYRDGARLLAGYRPSHPLARMGAQAVFAHLQAAGFGMPDALWALVTVRQFTFGWTMDEQAAEGRPPPPGPRLDPEAGFEFGLAVVIAGLREHLATQAPSSPAARSGAGVALS